MEYTGEELMGVLRVAHKYCMNVIEQDITKSLAMDTSLEGLINLLVASRIIDDKELHKKAWDSLIASTDTPDLEQARRMGLDLLYALLLNRKPFYSCRQCSSKLLYCNSCQEY
jgi:hypothetical protein